MCATYCVIFPDVHSLNYPLDIIMMLQGKSNSSQHEYQVGRYSLSYYSHKELRSFSTILSEM